MRVIVTLSPAVKRRILDVGWAWWNGTDKDKRLEEWTWISGTGKSKRDELNSRNGVRHRKSIDPRWNWGDGRAVGGHLRWNDQGSWPPRRSFLVVQEDEY